jgi:hypothetical protein
VDLELSVPGFDEQSYRRLARFLARVGLEPVRRETAALRLVITGESGVGGSDTGEGMRLIVALYDGERLRRSARLSFSGMSRRAVRELASSVADTVFAVSP